MKVGRFPKINERGESDGAFGRGRIISFNIERKKSL